MNQRLLTIALAVAIVLVGIGACIRLCRQPLNIVHVVIDASPIMKKGQNK